MICEWRMQCMYAVITTNSLCFLDKIFVFFLWEHILSTHIAFLPFAPKASCNWGGQETPCLAFDHGKKRFVMYFHNKYSLKCCVYRIFKINTRGWSFTKVKQLVFPLELGFWGGSYFGGNSWVCVKIGKSFARFFLESIVVITVKYVGYKYSKR